MVLALTARAAGLADVLYVGYFWARAVGQLTGDFFTEQTIVENDNGKVSQGRRLWRNQLGEGIIGVGAENKKLI